MGQLQLFRATTLVILKSEVPNVKIHQILRQRVNQVERNGKELGSQKHQQRILFINRNYQMDFLNCQRKLRNQNQKSKKRKKLPKNRQKLPKLVKKNKDQKLIAL